MKHQPLRVCTLGEAFGPLSYMLAQPVARQEVVRVTLRKHGPVVPLLKQLFLPLTDDKGIHVTGGYYLREFFLRNDEPVLYSGVALRLAL